MSVFRTRFEFSQKQLGILYASVTSEYRGINPQGLKNCDPLQQWQGFLPCVNFAVFSNKVQSYNSHSPSEVLFDSRLMAWDVLSTLMSRDSNCFVYSQIILRVNATAGLQNQTPHNLLFIQMAVQDVLAFPVVIIVCNFCALPSHNPCAVL